MKLSVKLPLLVAGAVTVATGIAGAVAVRVSQESMRRQALDSYRRSVSAYASAIGSYLDNAAAVLEVTAADSSVAGYDSAAVRDPALRGVGPDEARPQRRLADLILDTSPRFEYVALVDGAGRAFLVEPHTLQSKMARDDWSFLPWYRDASAGGRTVVSDLHISPVTQNPSVVIAVPIRDGASHTVGVWAGALRLETLSSVGSEGGVAGSYGFLTDARGLIIAHQANESYVRYQTDFATDPPVARAIRGEDGFGEWRNPVDHGLKLGAYRRLPGSGWAVVYSTDARDALAPARRAALEIALVSAGVVVLLGAACIVIARRTIRPLRRLGGAAQRVATGELDQRVAVVGRDEVAGLSMRFNEMLAALAEKDAELRGRASALEESNAELASFTYSVSHDLRAPLRAIDGFSKILLEEYTEVLDEHGRDYLGRVRAATQRMGRLIDDLLGLSRVGRAPIARERVDLTQLATEVVGELRAAAPSRVVSVSIEPGLVADGDPRLVKIALANLLDNAWKFTSKTPEASIELGAASRDPSCFFVRDNGAGFDMAYADKLFGAFQRLHKAAEFPGTGIGLATVRRIVARHGGRVWVSAEVNRGATFSFTLAPTAGDVPAGLGATTPRSEEVDPCPSPSSSSRTTPTTSTSPSTPSGRRTSPTRSSSPATASKPSTNSCPPTAPRVSNPP